MNEPFVLLFGVFMGMTLGLLLAPAVMFDNPTIPYEHTYSDGETCYFSPDGHAIYCDGDDEDEIVKEQLL